MNRKRSLMERLGLVTTSGESDTELAVTDDQPRDDWLDEESDGRLADDPWLDDEDEPGPWPDADAELAADDAAPDQAMASDDPDAITESGVTTNQLAESQETQRVGDATEVAPTEQQSEAASSDQQPEAASQPAPDPVAVLLAGSDEELEVAIQQAQAEADAAAEELEQWNRRQDELRQTRALAQQRIAELRPKRAELLAELLLRNNRRAKEQLDRISRTLQELEDVDRDYDLVLAVATQEAAKLLARVAHHSATVRQLQARLKARQLVRQAQAVDRAIVALLGELAQAQQLVEELAPLMPTAQQYLNQFRRGGGDLPIRLSLAYHCRTSGVGSILDLPPYSPQSSRPLSVQIGELLANLLKPTTDNSEVPDAELYGLDAPGIAATTE
jgi:hypothetical protein